MKKKLISLLLVSAMAAATAGCGSSVPANSVNSRDDLPGKKIGVQLGTTGDSDATEYEKNDGSTVERYNKGADAIQALKTGKIDCVIIDQQPAEAFVEKNDDLKILSDTFDPEEYAICIAKGNSDLTDKFISRAPASATVISASVKFLILSLPAVPSVQSNEAPVVAGLVTTISPGMISNRLNTGATSTMAFTLTEKGSDSSGMTIISLVTPS